MLKILKNIVLALSLLLLLLITLAATPQLFHSNKGISISHGSRFTGYLENGFLLPYTGDNFEYFSWTSYYIMDNAYVNNQVGEVVLKAYSLLEEQQPENQYVLMECSDHFGGPLLFHESHKNGLSIDFMSPKIKDNTPYTGLDGWGFAHYFLEFDSKGVLLVKYPFLNYISTKLATVFAQGFMEQEVSINFEMIAQHLLALQEATKGTNVRIRKVIFKLQLKDELYSGTYGKKLLKSGIPLATILPKSTNEMHEDHYHVDFIVTK
jgi:penicillin-insensitive murein DD-endopeptidase